MNSLLRIGALVAAVGLLLAPGTALAQCERDLTRIGPIMQSNGVQVMFRNIRLTPGGFEADAQYYWRTEDNDSRNTVGTVEGSTSGDYIEMVIRWSDPGRTVGVYRGRFSEHGRGEGEHWVQQRPDEEFAWYTNARLPCASGEPAWPPS